MKLVYITFAISLINLGSLNANASETYVPPNNGHPDGIVGSGTRLVIQDDSCNRGGSRQENCLQ